MDNQQNQPSEWPQAPAPAGAGAPTSPQEGAGTADRHRPPELPPMPPLNLPAQQAALPAEAPAVEELPPPAEERKKPHVLKTILLSFAIAVIVAGAGSALYFYVLPLVLPPSQPSKPSAPSPAPAPKPALRPHESYFVNEPAEVIELTLSAVNAAAIRGNLQTAAADRLTTPGIKELIISDNGGQVIFSDYLTAIAQPFSALDTENWFDKDFTAFMYYDANGAWPGYVAQLSLTANPEQVRQGLRQVENVLSLAGLYVSNPGTFTPFKDGKVGDYPTRYAVGAAAGAAFNYALAGDHLIISASYNGLKEAVALLGL